MKNLASSLVAIALTASPLIATADTEFEDLVPLELVQALLGRYGPDGPVPVYSDIADSFPDFDLPAGFEVMGSTERANSITVILTSELSPDEITTRLGGVFTAEDFSEFNVDFPEPEQNGFISPNQVIRYPSARYCHDSLGFVSFRTEEVNDRQLITLSSNMANDPRRCAAQLEEQQQHMSMRGMSMGQNLRSYIPRMEMPETEQRQYSPLFGIGGGSRSNSEAESNANLSIDWPIDEVYAHFKAQIEEQGWQLDSENIGNATVNASWTRAPEPGMNLIGSLSILASGDDLYELKFHLLATGQRTRSGIGTFIRGN